MLREQAMLHDKELKNSVHNVDKPAGWTDADHARSVSAENAMRDMLAEEMARA